MKASVYKGFIIFEILFSFIIVNIVFIGASVLTLLLMAPVLLVSLLVSIRRFYFFKEYQGFLFAFFYTIKGRIVRSFTVLFPLIVFIGILVMSVLYYNQILEYYFEDGFIVFVLLIQFLVLYQAIGVLLLSALYVSTDTKHKILDIYKYSFLLFNANPVRGLLSLVSLGAMIFFIIEVSLLGFFVVMPISLLTFYIVFSDVFEKKRIIYQEVE